MGKLWSLSPPFELILMMFALGVAVCPAATAVAQDRTYMDGFDPAKAVLFDAPEPAGLRKAVSPDGKLRAECKYGEVRVQSVQGDERLHTFTTTGGTYSPTFTPDGKNLIAAVCRGNLGCISTLYSWDLKTGERTRVGECSGLVLDMSMDSTGKRLAVATWYGDIGSVALYGEYKKWYAGEIVIINTETPDRSVRVFCELSDVLDFDEETLKDREAKEVGDELKQRLREAQSRCLPVRVGLTPDGAKVVGVTSTGVVRVFDAQTGKPELLLSGQGRAGAEFVTSVEQKNESSDQP